MLDTQKLLLPSTDHRTNVVLLLNGCFNPVHQNHVRLLEIAREHLNSLDLYHVVGGYLSPTHDAGIERKLAVLHSTWQDRLAMCRLAVEDSSWIMVDDWQIGQEKNQGAQQAKQRLTDLLRKSHPSIQVVSLCGGDALPKLKSTFKKELVICVINRPIEDFDFDEWYQSAAIKPSHCNIILLHDHQGSKHLSSTSIRRRLSQNLHDSLVDDLHPSVLDYHLQQGIRYRSATETVVWSDFDDPSEGVELGQGRCATVYARQYRDQIVAVKVIRDRKQFEHETKILQLLIDERSHHLHVVRILGIGNQFCVMERCDTDLLSFIQQHRFASNQTLPTSFPDRHWRQWIDQMLSGFVHLVSLGILHRDIKTDNILLSKMVVKISDFSVSINTNAPSKMPLRGSIRHYAPEAIEEKKIYTEKADVYMFGCLLYEIVHGGERVWKDISTFAVVQRRSKGEKPAFFVPCEPWYMDVVSNDCWAINADERSTFSQLQQNILAK